MGKHIDLSGKRFGRLVVTNEFLITKEGRRKWKCLCDCGNIAYVVTNKFDRRFALEYEGFIVPGEVFRWKMLDESLNMRLY